MKRLGDVCEIIKGRKPTVKAIRARGDLPYLVAKVLRGTKKPEYASINDRNSITVEESETIIICDGSNSGEIFSGFRGILSSTMGKISKKAKIDDGYLRIFLASTFEIFNSAKIGAAIPHLDKEAMYELQFPLPPLHDQQRIVSLLDEAIAAIYAAKLNAQKNVQNSRAFLESYIESGFSNKKWKWEKLGSLCDGVEYGSSAKSKKLGGIPVLRMGNIQDGSLDWGNLAYTDDNAEIAKYLLKHNDVLFNRTNSPELVGKTAIYKSEMPAIFAGYLIRICRKQDLLDADYLCYFLNSRIAREHGKTVVISSVNQANINGAKLKDYPIPAPSLSEQRSFVSKIDSLRRETQRLVCIYERKLAALEALKSSLLDRAFSGKL